MMTPVEAAEEIGVTKKQLYRIIKQSGIRMRLTIKGGYYRFSPEDIEEVREWRRQQARPQRSARHAEKSADKAIDLSVENAHTPYLVGNIDLKAPSPALPLEYLNDPAWHDAFVRERQRRELRLMVLVRQAGLPSGAHIPRCIDLDDEY